MQGFEGDDAGLVLLEQALLDDFVDIAAGQLHASGKASLDLGVIVAVLLAHLADDAAHVFLGGDDDPGAPVTLGGKALGDGLQVGHELGVVGNVLADFVDKEVKPKVGPLGADVAVDLLGEVFDGEAVVGAVFVEDAAGAVGAAAGGFGVGGSDVVGFQQKLLAATLPGNAGGFFKGALESRILVALVELALELGDIGLFAVVAAVLVEHLNKDGQQCIDLRLGDDGGFLVDVEQDAARGDGDGALDIGMQNLIVFALGQEEVAGDDAFDIAILKQDGKGLEQVRLTGAEEPGDPDAIGAGIVVVGIEKALKASLDLVGENVFFEFEQQADFIVGLDHTIDGAVDFLEEDFG